MPPIDITTLQKCKIFSVIDGTEVSIKPTLLSIEKSWENMIPTIKLEGYVISNHTTSELIKQVIFNNPATIVIWNDGTKTVVKCQEGDIYSKELGLAMAISKKFLGNKSNFNNVFNKWIKEENLSGRHKTN